MSEGSYNYILRPFRCQDTAMKCSFTSSTSVIAKEEKEEEEEEGEEVLSLSLACLRQHSAYTTMLVWCSTRGRDLWKRTWTASALNTYSCSSPVRYVGVACCLATQFQHPHKHSDCSNGFNDDYNASQDFLFLEPVCGGPLSWSTWCFSSHW